MKNAPHPFRRGAFNTTLLHQADFRPLTRGMLRTRLPDAAKIAVPTAAPISDVDGSPVPPGFSLLWTKVISMTGDSF